MKKSLLLLLFATLAFGFVAAGCGGDDDADDAGDDTATTAAAASDSESSDDAEPMDDAGDDMADDGADDMAADEPMGVDLAGVDLKLWGWASSEAEDTQLNAVVDMINEASGANVVFEPQPEYDTALQAALVAGDPPNAFYIDSSRLPDMVDSGALMPVPDGAISDPDDIYPALRDVFTVDGTWYCPPKDFSTLALVYDPAALADAGVDVPATWDELATAAAAVTTDDRVGLTFGAEYARAGAFLFQAGSGILNDDQTAVAIDSAGAREALGFLADLFEAGHAGTPADVDAGWAGEAFGDGKAAMTITGNWIVGYLHQNYPERDWAVAELPEGPVGKGTFAFTVCYGVAASVDNPDESWALVDHLTNSTGAAAWTSGFQVMPARSSVRAQWIADNPELEAFVAGAEYASRFQFPAGAGDIQGVFNDNFQKLIAGETTIDDLIDEVVAAGNDLL